MNFLIVIVIKGMLKVKVIESGTNATWEDQEKAAAAQNTALTKALSQVQSTGDFNTLMTLLGSQQQPVQQAPMQDPYAHIKLMEDLFGSEIDLTPAGENTTQRK